MSKEYEFISTENDGRDDLDYEEVQKAVFGGDDYEYEIKKAKKKLKKYFKKRTLKPKKMKKMKKKISKLKGELEKIKKEQRKSKLMELINCDNASQRKQLIKEIFEEEGIA